MLRVLLVVLLSQRMRTAHLTDPPNRYNKIYQELEKLRLTDRQLAHSPQEKLYEKLNALNSLSDDRFELSDDDEELLSAMQEWGKLSEEEMDGVMKDLQQMKDLQRLKVDRQDASDKSEEYGDADWSDDEADYANDANEDWDADEPVDSTPRPQLGINPLAITRTGPYEDLAMRGVLDAVEAIAATKARPRIVDDPTLSVAERAAIRSAAMLSMKSLLRSGKCVEPQPRWMVVRQLAPATDTMYMPPCVQLHRCAPDAGCCVNEGEVCAPVEGKIVGLPFFLHKTNRNMSAVKMQFFNHTRCACVSREKLQASMASRASRPTLMDIQEEEERTVKPIDRQSDWRTPTEVPILEKDEEATAPPQLRRCTCPAQFLASMSDVAPCACVCEWPSAGRRRDCQSLARGKEHFSLRDRVCVSNGDCTVPSCEYGSYDRTLGKCPMRRFRRLKFHGRGRYQAEKTVVV